jgi:hypothetical protein
MSATSLNQTAHLAAGTKRFGAIAAQQHTNDLRVFGPRIQAFAQDVDHWQGKGVQGLFGIQAGDTDTRAVGAGKFFEVQIHFDLDG